MSRKSTKNDPKYWVATKLVVLIVGNKYDSQSTSTGGNSAKMPTTVNRRPPLALRKNDGHRAWWEG